MLRTLATSKPVKETREERSITINATVSPKEPMDQGKRKYLLGLPFYVAGVFILLGLAAKVGIVPQEIARAIYDHSRALF